MKLSKSKLHGRGSLLGVAAVALVIVTSAQAANTVYENTVLNDGPLAFYPLDLNVDTGSTATDLSGHSITGSLVNISQGSNLVPGPSPAIPNAAEFDGQTEYVDLGGASNSILLNFSGKITLEAWAQTQTGGNNPADIVAKGNDSSQNQDELALRANSFNGSFYGGSYNNTAGGKASSGGTANTNWAHLVVSNDGTNWVLYVNGVAQTPAADSVGAFTFTDPWRIGSGSADGRTRLFSGAIAQVAIYNIALPASQIYAHYFVGQYGVLPSNSVPIITSQPTPQVGIVGGSATFSVGVLSVLPTTNQWYLGGNPIIGQTNATLSLSNLSSSGNYSVVIGNKNGTTNSVAVSLTLKSLGAYSQLVLADRPLAYYPITPVVDTQNVATDVSGNGNNAVFTTQNSSYNTGQGPTPYITNSDIFDGSTFADMSTGANAGILNFGGQITEEAWIQPSSTSGSLHNILAKGYDSAQNYNEIQMRVDGNTISANGVNNVGSISAGTWYHVVNTVSNGTSTVYINGQLAGTGGNGGVPNFTDHWAFGAGTADGAGRTFFGNITEVALYNYALSAGQVANHYIAAVYGANPSNVAPVITLSPTPQSAYAGGAVQFTASALSGPTVSYQWFKGSTAIVGQTNTMLNLLNVQAGDATTYYVAVTSSAGSSNSAPVSLTLLTVTPPTPGNSLDWAANNNNGSWDNTTANWINQSNLQQTNFNANDRVLFDDTVGVPLTVSLNDSVAPSTVTNNSSVNDFIINGGGKITGNGGIVKSGASTLEIESANDFTGPFTIKGGIVQLDEPLTGSVTTFGATNGAPIVVTNGAELVLNVQGSYPIGNTGIIDNKLIVVSGTGADGNGAIQTLGNDIYHDGGGLFRNLRLAGDTLIGSTHRLDFGAYPQFTSISTGGSNYNFTLNTSYSTWREVVIDTNLGNIDLYSTGNSWDFYGMGQTGLGNPTNVLTVHPSANLSFWHEATGQDSGYNKIIHVMSGSQFSYRPSGGGGDYHIGTSLIMDDGSGWNFFNGDGGNGTGVVIGGTIVLNGKTTLSTGNSPLAFTNVISGAGGFVWQNYDHNVTFSAVNTYQGTTGLGNGRTLMLAGNGSISQSTNIYFGGSDGTFVQLDVSGRPDNTLTLATGQTLGGIGRVSGNIVVTPNAAIAPAGTNATGSQTLGGNVTGTLSASGGVTLQGTATLKVNGNGNSDTILAVGSGIAIGGTLNIVNVSTNALVAGNSFQLFIAPSYSGVVPNIVPVTPGAGLTWDKSQLLTSGRLAVSGSARPSVTSVHVAGGKLILSGVNGPTSGNFLVLSSTNVSALLSTWTVVSTNAFNSDGTFGATNTISGTTSQQFFTIKEQ